MKTQTPLSKNHLTKLVERGFALQNQLLILQAEFTGIKDLLKAEALNRSTEEQDRIRFLNLRRLPARLTVQQTAWVLGVRPHSIQVLVSHRLLKPIGAPARKATDLLYQFVEEKNAAQAKRKNKSDS
jgi:hypothetical protein